MSHILLTGFTPFDGREFNASWIAARALVMGHGTKHILHGLRIPVCWGQPRESLLPAIARWRPRCIIAMGEGERGHFKIETVARNQRKARLDNAGQLPPAPSIDPLGPVSRPASAPCAALCDELASAGFPVVLSSDAGAYLCEELLYTLEALKEQYVDPGSVLFVHVPPYGSDLLIKDVPRQCDEFLLHEFASKLLETCMQLNMV